jgi:hypothetical protein
MITTTVIIADLTAMTALSRRSFSEGRGVRVPVGLAAGTELAVGVAASSSLDANKIGAGAVLWLWHPV